MFESSRFRLRADRFHPSLAVGAVRLFQLFCLRHVSSAAFEKISDGSLWQLVSTSPAHAVKDLIMPRKPLFSTKKPLFATRKPPFSIEETPFLNRGNPFSQRGNPSSQRGNPSSQRGNPSTLLTTDPNPHPFLLSFPLGGRA